VSLWIVLFFIGLLVLIASSITRRGRKITLNIVSTLKGEQEKAVLDAGQPSEEGEGGGGRRKSRNLPTSIAAWAGAVLAVIGALKAAVEFLQELGVGIHHG
jgi:hypothetical protein